MARFGGMVRSYADGAAVADGTDVVIKDSAGATVETLETAAGLWEYQENLNPKGRLDAHVVVDGVTRVESSRAPRQVGPVSVAELTHVLKALGKGVVADAANELAVTATGTRQLSVATGAALVDGVPCVVYAATSPAVAGSANTSGVTRSDCLVLRVTRPGYDENEGKSELVIHEGSATAPSDTSQYAYLRLASMTLAHNGTSYAVTDQRTYLLDAVSLPASNATVQAVARAAGPASVGGSMAAVSGASTTLTLADGVTYDVVVEAWAVASAASIAPYYGSAADRATAVSWSESYEVPLANVHVKSGVVGTGAAVTVGLAAQQTDSGGSVQNVVVSARAIPRAG